MRKLFQKKLIKIYLSLIIATVVITAAVIFVDILSPNGDMYYVNQENLQSFDDDYGVLGCSYNDGFLLQYLVETDKTDHYTLGDNHKMRMFRLDTREVSEINLTKPSNQHKITQQNSDGSYVEEYYINPSICILEDKFVAVFNCITMSRDAGSEKSELISQEPHIYFYSFDGVCMEDVSMQKGEEVSAELTVDSGKMVADEAYIYTISSSFEKEEVITYLTINDYQGNSVYCEQVSEDSYLLPISSKVGALLYSESELYHIAGNNKKEIALGTTFDYVVQSGDERYDFLYKKGSNLYGYSMDAKKKECLIKSDEQVLLELWSNDSPSYYYNDTVYCCYNDETSTNQLITMSRDERLDESESMKTLYLASVGPSYTGRLTTQFREDNPDYVIKTREFESTIELLDAIGKGEQIDLVDLSGVDKDALIHNDLLEDLYPYIENDKELSKADFIQEVIHVFENDGKLYEAVIGYYPITILGKQSVIGDAEWDFYRMQEVENRESTLFGREEVLNSAFLFYQNKIIVQGNSEMTCNFHFEPFEKQFVASKSFAPLETIIGNDDVIDMVNMLENRGLIEASLSITDIAFISYYNSINSDDILVLGYPKEKENVTFYGAASSLGIISTSKEKDQAWEYIKPYFTTQYQATECYQNGFFPIRRDVQEILNETLCATQPYENEYIGWVDTFQSNTAFYYQYQEEKWGAATIGDVEAIEAQLVNAEPYPNYDRISPIILEEAMGYWEGSKTPESCIDVINSRVNIVINE